MRISDWSSDVCSSDLLLGDGLRAAPLGALEHHVLEQMRDAVQLRRLVARAGADPGAEGDGGDARHGIRGDRESGRQPGYLDAHAAPFARTGALRRLLRTKSCKTASSLGSVAQRSSRS